MDRRSFIALSLFPSVSLAQTTCRAVEKKMPYKTHPKIYKQAGSLIPRPNETTPLVIGGQILAFSTPREAFNPVCIEVRNYQTGALMASPAWSGIFGTFAEDGGVVHAWGATSGAGGGNSLIHSQLAADFTPSAPDVVKQFPSYDRVWNVSVCKDATGWAMALETLYPGTLPTNEGFNIIFYRAPSIYGPWTAHSNAFNYNPNPPYQLMFSAFCPTLKYRDGWYYMFYMQPDGQTPPWYNTFVARSQTLLPGSWQFGSQIVIAADGPGGEQTNASDFDYIEHNGVCWGTYFAGDQVNQIPVKRCMYPGTEAQLFAEFF